MKLNYLLRYMIVDYLLEQKERIEKLEQKLKTTTNEARKPLIKAQIEIYFQQGLEALTWYERDCPKSVRDYFLGHRQDRPDYQEISTEMADRVEIDRNLNSKIVYISLAIGIGILTVLYFFSF